MGVLPLQFIDGANAESLRLTGEEVFTIKGVEALNTGVTPTVVAVEAFKENGEVTQFTARVRIDTPGEADYYRNGGILQYVLRKTV
jgi:aconitate hydratase